MARNGVACSTRRPVRRRLLLVVLSVVSLAAALVLAGSAAAESPLKWSPPTNIDGTHELSGISCPSAGLCVAIDRMNTDVVTSANPTGGASAWTVTPIGTDDATGISCALSGESKLCVAVDCRPKAWFSTNPLGGAGTWTGTLLGAESCGFHTTTGVSCASIAMCVAIDSVGDVIVSGKPTGSTTDWKSNNVDGANFLSSISCPTTSLCVAVDNKGNAVTSTSPLGGGAWNVAQIDSTKPLSSVSCASETLCVAGDEAGNVLTSTNPTGGAAAWSVAHVDGTAGVSGMSCPSSSLCVGVDNQSGAVSSTNPTGGASAWTREVIDVGQLPKAVSCASSSLCVATDWHGNVIVGTGAATMPPPEETSKNKTGTPEVTSKGKAGTPETHLIAPETQILSTESNGEGKVTTLLSCAPVGGECGPLNIQLSAQLKVEGKKVVGVLAKAKRKKTSIKSVIVASATVSIPAGQQKKVTLTLNATGKSLLAKFKHLSTQIRVISKGTVLSTRTVKLVKHAKHKSRA